MPSEDGWEPSRLAPDSPQLVWRTVPGTDPPVRLQIQVGQPTSMLLAFAADLNAFVEPMRDADSACYTPTNAVATSNHLNATCFDYNWNSHPFHEFNTFNPGQMATLAELFDFYSIGDLKLIAWGGKDWGGNPQDEMHFQMGYNTFGNPLTQKFIDTFIRLDGFSTFRRGPMSDAVDILARATGVSMEWASEILPTVTSGLLASRCNNVNRIAMWLAQCGVESASFTATEEFASGAEYEGRCNDLGNCSPGDGVRYKGRTWIQITGKAHYVEFSQWAFDRGLTSTPTQFVDDPVSLGDIRWAGIGAAWYWVVSRPDINELSDNGDVVTVTHRINGGEHALAQRQDRYNRAHSLGDQLLSLATQQQPSEGEDMALVPQAQWDAFYRAYMDDVPSQSPLRWPGEGTIGSTNKLTRNMDGNIDIIVVKVLATLRDPATLLRLHTVATMDLSQFPDRTQFDKELALQILADSSVEPVAVSPPIPAPVVVQEVTPVQAERLPALPASPVVVAESVPARTSSDGTIAAVLAQLELLSKFSQDLPTDIAESLAKLLDNIRNY